MIDVEPRIRGTVRKLERVGLTVRAVIPRDLARQYGLDKAEFVEVLSASGGVLLRPFQPGCVLCGGPSEDGVDFRDRRVCRRCVEELLRHVRIPVAASEAEGGFRG